MTERAASPTLTAQDSRPPSPVDEGFPWLDQDPAAGRPQAPYRFNWAKSHSRRGPPSVSEATESRVDLADSGSVQGAALLQRVGSSLNLSAFPPDWSSSRYGFNAISNVLNNPHRKPAPLRSSRFPLPSVPPADLPRVRRKDFDAYLQSVRPEWERFQRNIQIGQNGIVRSESGRDLLASPSSSQDAAPTMRNVPGLSTVPPVFFDPEFNLGSPRTFASVTEQDSDYARSAQAEMGPEDISVNQILQEKLAHYMDVVEQHLVQEIAQRSSSFFAALSNLQDLQTEGEQCLTRIGKLRAELKEVDENQAMKGLEVVRLQVKRDSLEEVLAGVKALREVGETVSMAKHLIGGGDYFEALGMIEDVEESLAPKSISADLAWKARSDLPTPRTPVANGSAVPLTPILESPGTPGPIPPSSPVASKATPSRPPRRQSAFDLAALKALSTLPAHLRELSLAISQSLESDMVAVLRADLSARVRRRDQSDEKDETKARFGDLEEAAELRERLSPILHGLLRVRGVNQAVRAYREAALSEVKTAIKMHLPASDAEEEDASGKPQTPKPLSERNAALTRELRDMALQDYLQLSRGLYGSLMRCIKAVGLHAELVTEVVKPLIPPPAPPNDNTSANTPPDLDLAALSTDLSNIVVAVAEAANSRASRIVALRQEQHAALELEDFMPVFNVSWEFVLASEGLCRKMIVGLRGAMVSQCKAFLSSFHATRLTQSATLVENEQWIQVDVSPASQHCVKIIVDAAVSDPPELSLSTATVPTTNGTTAKDSSKQLHIEDRPYYVVSATIEVLKLLVDYLKVMANMPLLITDVMARIIEFLKAFNSRTCQVVLGAGAMRSAGLKNITAKHLALASQSLSIMIALIPYVREAMRRHLNPTQAVILVEFDKLKRDYQEHQNEIHSKLIAIMGDRLAIHVKTFQEIKWDTPKATPGPNAYMETIVKETVTLHKVLSRYLATPVVEYVMGQVLATTNHRLGEEYSKIDLPSQEAKTRLLQDARYLSEKLGNLRGINLPSTTMLENVVSERPVHGDPPPAPVPPAPMTRKSPFVGRRAFSGLLSRAMGEIKKDDIAAAPVVTPILEKNGKESAKDPAEAAAAAEGKPSTEETPEMTRAWLDGAETPDQVPLAAIVEERRPAVEQGERNEEGTAPADGAVDEDADDVPAASPDPAAVDGVPAVDGPIGTGIDEVPAMPKEAPLAGEPMGRSTDDAPPPIPNGSSKPAVSSPGVEKPMPPLPPSPTAASEASPTADAGQEATTVETPSAAVDGE